MTDPKVRMLVTAVGYNEASRQLGIKAATLRKRAQREHWLRPSDLRAPNHDSREQVTPSHASHFALENALRAHASATKINMARYAERASRDASKHRKPLTIARAARDVEGIRASLWPEKNEGNILTLNVLNAVKVVRPERDVDASAMDS
jgi:hypothetical protein